MEIEEQSEGPPRLATATLRGLRPLLATALRLVDDALAKAPAAIVRLLEREGREMAVRDIVDALQVAGRDVTEDAVSQACHRLAAAETIQRVRHGVYARRAG